jgi:hypothetical protein
MKLGKLADAPNYQEDDCEHPEQIQNAEADCECDAQNYPGEEEYYRDHR